jgi:Trp operon repressor
MVTDRPGFPERYKTILEQLNAGEISRRKAARELDIGYATLKRMLDGKGAYHRI